MIEAGTESRIGPRCARADSPSVAEFHELLDVEHEGVGRVLDFRIADDVAGFVNLHDLGRGAPERPLVGSDVGEGSHEAHGQRAPEVSSAASRS